MPGDRRTHPEIVTPPIKTRTGALAHSSAARCSVALCSIALLTATLPISGCESQAGARMDTSSAARESAAASGDYMTLYQSGQYARAYETASQAATSPRERVPQRAQLVAGLAAQALNRNADAERWLKPLVKDADPNIAGKAGASLGLVAQEQGRHADAAALLGEAADKLDGEDGARAAMYAGDSFAALKKPDEARAKYQHALDAAQRDSALRLMIGDRLSALPRATPHAAPPLAQGATGRGQPTPVPSTPPASRAGQSPAARGTAAPPLAAPTPRGHAPTVRSRAYAVQAGAFTSFAAARRRADALTRFGPARIVEVEEFGRRLFAVQVGHFASAAEAGRLRGMVGGNTFVVAASNP